MSTSSKCNWTGLQNHKKSINLRHQHCYTQSRRETLSELNVTFHITLEMGVILSSRQKAEQQFSNFPYTCLFVCMFLMFLSVEKGVWGEKRENKQHYLRANLVTIEYFTWITFSDVLLNFKIIGFSIKSILKSKFSSSFRPCWNIIFSLMRVD